MSEQSCQYGLVESESSVEISLEYRDGLYFLPLRLRLSDTKTVQRAEQTSFSEQTSFREQTIKAVMDLDTRTFVVNEPNGQGKSEIHFYVDEPSVDAVVFGEGNGEHVELSLNTTNPEWIKVEAFVSRTVTTIKGQSSFAFSKFTGVNAVVGLAFSRFHDENSKHMIQSLQISGNQISFALNQQSPRLYFGSIRRNICMEDFLWSEAHPIEGINYIRVFHFSICGRDLTPFHASSAIARISTLDRCLGLPSTLFRNLMSWIPAVCEASRAFCSVPDGVVFEQLPHIVFALQESKKDDSFHLSLPLHSLVDRATRNYCIIKKEQDNTITLGSMVLESFNFSINTEFQRVGFWRDMQRGIVVNAATCMPNATCIGDQWLDMPSNTCVDPHCTSVFFYRLNHATKTCEINPAINIVVFSLVFVCLFLDIFSKRLAKRHLRSVYKNIR